jgi:hypothetical protein
LTSDGCTELQGYLFSKPRPGKAVPEMILRLDAGFTQFTEQTTTGGFCPTEVILDSGLYAVAAVQE